MSSWSKETKQSVWDKAAEIPGKDPDKFRKDPYGNTMNKDDYGKNTPNGWVIDHINPEKRGGSDAIRNLQALNTKKNSELQDSKIKRSRHNQ